MGTNAGTIMTLANSIIGVSVLAMPFCFKQCGIVLSILMLIASSLLSRLACHFLLKSAVMARRRTFEFLAFHTFGLTGKFTVELFIIGFLMGTCIAFFVVMGDLGPAIVAKILGVSNTTSLRPSVLIGLALFVVLPLGMLRNVDSLSSVSIATIGFYICLVMKVVGESLPHLLAGDWYENVHFWRPAGIMQCIPIFSMALFCQTQLFEIYESMHNASLDRMNYVIRAACNICTGVYICVGFFGYIAFCTKSFTGNVLMSFTPSITSEMIKLGFVLSVAVSFPLAIFPCRASLYSLLFRRITMPHHEGVSSHIPEARFKCLTIFIISVALVIGLLIPNIELVLGLVGSTIGVLICVMFPAAAFICMSSKSSNDRLLAQVLLFIGALILVLGTYATLDSANDGKPEKQSLMDSAPPVAKLDPLSDMHEKINNIVDVPPKLEETKMESNAKDDSVGVPKEKQPAVLVNLNPAEKQEAAQGSDLSRADKRQEPPVPMEPAVAVPSASSLAKGEKVLPAEPLKRIEKEGEPIPEDQKPKAPVPQPEKEEKLVAAEQVDQDAIKKEDEELAEAEKGHIESKNDEIFRKLEKHEEAQIKILQEQRQILEALKEHKERDVQERMEQKLQQPLPQVQQEQQQMPKEQSSVIGVKKANEIKLQPLQKIQVQDTNVGEKIVNNVVNDVEKPEMQPKQQQDLLKQIANGELKKPIDTDKSKPLIEEPVVKQLSKDAFVSNQVAIHKNVSVILPDVQVPQHVAAPEPKIELPAVPVQTVLLERLKNQVPASSSNKSLVQPLLPVPKVVEKPEESVNEINAMRREILQESLASTLKNKSPVDVRERLPTNKKDLQPHDREKRNIEQLEKVTQPSIDPADNTPDVNEQNCQMTEKTDLEEVDLTPKVISNDIDNLKINKMPDTMTTGPETVLHNENDFLSAHRIFSPSRAPEIEKSVENSMANALRQNSSKGKEHLSEIEQIPQHEPVEKSKVVQISQEPGRIGNNQNEQSDDTLVIKTASHLSDPKIESNDEKNVEALMQGGSPPSDSEVKPMKRDLKSIVIPEDKKDSGSNHRKA